MHSVPATQAFELLAELFHRPLGMELPVQVLEPAPEAGGDMAMLEVVLAGDRVIRVPAGFKRESLKRLISVLEESC